MSFFYFFVEWCLNFSKLRIFEVLVEMYFFGFRSRRAREFVSKESVFDDFR